MNFIRRALVASLALGTVVAPLGATWSILIVDTRTGEIAVGSATCVPGYSLKMITPVLLVNRGAATAQASVNIGSITNRALIWRSFKERTTPTKILQLLANNDPGHQTRQYGIIDVSGGKVTFSGTQNFAWAGGVTGSFGTIHYAIQGNILTGQGVVTAAEQAVINTPGDLSEKLMAGMEAARAMGGDGRCSCLTGSATSCGVPPPSFTKSAHIGFMVVARQGDTDGTCNNASIGCASGQYWMDLNVANQTASSPPPVPQLRTLFDAWRQTLSGRPDHHLSAVSLDPTSLLPDGSSTVTATITARDWAGAQLPSGGATVTVTQDPGGPPVSIGAVTDNGDGTYSFPVTAGTTVGTAQLRVVIDDGVSPVLLSPRTAVTVRADSLWASTARVEAAAGGAVSLLLDAGSGNALAPYVVAASGSGTNPGVPLGAVVLPLNPDPWFTGSLLLANSAVFANTFGTLDIAGRAQAQFIVPGGNVFAPAIGTDLDFAFALIPFTFASNPVRVSIR